jgi:hypothetical protein
MRFLKPALGVGIVLALIASVAFSQEGFSSFQKWREEHKATFQLRTMVTRGLAECEQNKATEIKQPQAKQLLAVLTPWRSKAKMTQAEARATIQQVQKVLEAKQVTAIDKVLLEEQHRLAELTAGSAPRPGAPATPSAGGGSNRLPFDPVKSKNFNPFNPAKDSPMYDRNKARNDKLFAFLTARASGKGGKLELPILRPSGGPVGPRRGGSPTGS